jgi:hypothetical protein
MEAQPYGKTLNLSAKFAAVAKWDAKSNPSQWGIVKKQPSG